MSTQSNDAYSSGSRDFDCKLQDRRERIRSFATQAGIPTLACSNFDRIGPVRAAHIVNYETEILWGNLCLEEFFEHDDLQAAGRITKRVKSITEEYFDPLAYFRDFQNAYRLAAAWFPRYGKPQNAGLRIDHVYAAFAPNKVRSGDGAKTRGMNSKNYSLSEFLVDFARFCREPVSHNDYFISVPEVCAGDLEQAFLVPNLKDPLSEEKPILRVAVVSDY